MTLTAGQAQANQNFRELGLRAEFIYNRLLTTTVLPVGSNPWNAAIRQIIVAAEQPAAASVSLLSNAVVTHPVRPAAVAKVTPTITTTTANPTTDDIHTTVASPVVLNTATLDTTTTAEGELNNSSFNPSTSLPLYTVEMLASPATAAKTASECGVSTVTHNDRVQTIFGPLVATAPLVEIDESLRASPNEESTHFKNVDLAHSEADSWLAVE